MVNNEPGRDATLAGMPPGIKTVSIYTTAKNCAMKRGQAIKVSKGKIRFHLDAQSYITLLNEQGYNMMQATLQKQRK